MTPPLGVTPRHGGVDVAVFSAHADSIDLCTFDASDRETGRFALADRTGDVLHGFIAGIAPGTLYGLRAHGRFAPAEGHRFNPNKLLLDPYATHIDRRVQLHPSLFDTQDAPSPSDSAAFMPKAVVMKPPAAAASPPPVQWSDLIIYEVHVRGFSAANDAVPRALRGTFAGLAHPASIDYLQRLGVTAVELLPCAAWLDERHLPPLGLANYWGYNPVSFCAPDPRLAPGGFGDIAACVAALRQAGIATILDVVFNHSGEGDELGPTVSLRGLDNAYYYRLRGDNPRYYVNDAGCGNILAADRPGVVRLVMDALRLWARVTGADGFRFDLATTLGRDSNGFSPAAPLLTAIAQDPDLRDRILIAEPWDIGRDGYRLGQFGAPWAEWNDRTRDTMRKFWRGDAFMLGDMATRLAGSADILAATRRPPSRGINFVTAHDGFTLRDLVSYTHKRNDANGEQNRDGTDTNLSWNHGAEGPTDDPRIVAARAADSRALLATLLFCRGTPMLTMGDEAGRTQQGNNNAYAQDNPVSWFDWSDVDPDLFAFTQRAIALRRATAPLRQDRLLSGASPDDTAMPDAAWLTPDGAAMAAADWQNQDARTLIAVLYTPPARAIVILHAGWEARKIVLPPPLPAHAWQLALDSFDPPREAANLREITAAPRSVLLLCEQEIARPEGAAASRAGCSLATLQRLAAASGLALSWWDVAGIRHPASPETLHALLRAQYLPAASEAQARDSLARLARQRDLRPLPACLVIEAGAPATLRLGPGTGGRDRWLVIEPESDPADPVRLHIAGDDGISHGQTAADGTRFTARAITLPALQPGRYRLHMEGVEAATHVTVAPPRCYLPEALLHGGRRFGIACHLYTLRRPGDQGIGDFSALAELAAVAGAQGAAILGLNPLHALFRATPERASPYHPADRRFLNPIYIDVSDLGSLNDSPYVRAALTDQAGALSRLRAAPAVDYTAVWQAKNIVLRAAFAALAHDPATDAALDAFIAEAGRKLRDFATWEALADANGADWHTWPDAVRPPDAPAVAAFARAHPAELRFSAFLQFLAERGLAGAAAATRQAGLDIGLYRDLAVGCAPDGAEAWSEQGRLLRGASVGAPPDPLGPLGQVWHLPPPDPLAMQDDGYRAFADLLATNMRHAGALRIDHVMGLTRLFLIPDGGDARDGTYLSYNLNDMLGQVALESRRAACLVVGEDLGTVPPEMGVALAEKSVLSYRVLWFEEREGQFRPPAAWPPLAAACVSTHDLPTFLGWWSGADIAELEALGRIDAPAARAARAATKAALLDLLRAEHFAVGDEPPLEAVHALIARTPSMLALVQADDLAGERIGVNLPGTDRERPNWRRRLACGVAQLRDNAVLAAMKEERKEGLLS